jgi:hypothetical protein
MAQHVSFGRRGLAHHAAPAAKAMDHAALSAEAEAFRAGLADGGVSAEDGFDGWLRARRGRRLVAWLITFALLTPGVLCFVLKTSPPVSVGLEVVGLVLSVWLRRQRRKHLSEIASWSDQV